MPVGEGCPVICFYGCMSVFLHPGRGEEIAFENGAISNFKGLMTLTLTFNRVILHTIVHHSSTATYMPN